MRAFSTLLLLGHGLIHLPGFLRAFRLASLPELTGRTLFRLPEALERPIGLLWLVTCLSFVSAAGLLTMGNKLWWSLAAAGVLTSQLLIVHAWPDARWGTLGNVLLLVPLLMGYGHARFARDNERALRVLLAEPSREPTPRVQLADLERLPTPVRRWLLASKVVGKPIPRTVWLHQQGQLRGDAQGRFMPVQATQVFRVDRPGFVWCADVSMWGLPVSGRDSYLTGHGHMSVRLGGLLSVVEAANEKIDEATLQRFLAEMVWFPAAALDPRIVWSETGSLAEATLLDGDVRATVQLEIDAQGRFRRLRAMRYKDARPTAQRQPWLVTAHAHDELAGVVVPTEGEVQWQLATGDLTVFRFRVDALRYDGGAGKRQGHASRRGVRTPRRRCASQACTRILCTVRLRQAYDRASCIAPLSALRADNVARVMRVAYTRARSARRRVPCLAPR